MINAKKQSTALTTRDGEVNSTVSSFPEFSIPTILAFFGF